MRRDTRRPRAGGRYGTLEKRTFAATAEPLLPSDHCARASATSAAPNTLWNAAGPLPEAEEPSIKGTVMDCRQARLGVGPSVTPIG